MIYLKGKMSILTYCFLKASEARAFHAGRDDN